MAKKQPKQQQQAMPAAPAEADQSSKIDFDAWWATVEKQLPWMHRKEIVLADFKARGLSLKETTNAYYGALEKYGFKLK